MITSTYHRQDLTPDR